MTNGSNRILVETKDVAGKKLELAVIKPTNRIAQKANLAYNMKVSSLIRKGGDGGERLLLRSEVEEYLINSEIWTQDDATKMEQLGLEIRARELLLRKGGIKLSDARKLAIDMSDLRSQMLDVYQKRQQLDSATVESIAEEYRFAVLVVECTVDAQTGKQYFKDYDDYVDRGDEEASVSVAQALASDLFNINADFRDDLYENKWLTKAGYMDDTGRYVNRKGKFVDKNGQLVNSDGRYINEKNELVDKHGRKVDIEGEFLVKDTQPFIDDEGNPIVLDTTKKVSTKKKQTKAKKKKTRKKTKV